LLSVASHATDDNIAMRFSVVKTFFAFHAIFFSLTVANLRQMIYNILTGGDFMSIGDRIKSRRKHLRMSADELGKRIGKDRSTIFRYEKGDIENLPLDILEPIAKALNTTPQYLMGWEDVQKKNDTLTDIVLRLRSDDIFLEAVESLYKMDSDKLLSLLGFLK
jgi:transcriptional regulator with XRE-family HTH domain